MLQLLGVAGGVSSAELFGAWRAFFEALAGTGTVVLVFQDVHWADSGTLDFIDHLVEWSREFPIFIVSLARPEILEERPEWGSARRSFTSAVPGADRRGGDARAPQGPRAGASGADRQSIVSQAEGVPLFAVEIIRMLDQHRRARTERGRDVPPPRRRRRDRRARDAHGADRRPARCARAGDRALLLDAAVLGQSFTPEGLAAVSGRSVAEIEPRLKALTRRELLRHVVDERSPERGPVRVRPGTRPGDRLQHPREEGPPDPPPRGGALVRDARRAGAGRRARRPLPRRPLARARRARRRMRSPRRQDSR